MRAQVPPAPVVDGVVFTNLTQEVQRPNKKLGYVMLNVTLNNNDSLETVLPTVELAMQTGDVCSIRNVNILGQVHMAALTLLVMSKNLMDSETGQIIRPHPGFLLLGIDEHGVARTMVM